MCKELSDLDKENLEEVEDTLEHVKKGEFKIVKHEHLVKNMKIKNEEVPIYETYKIEFIYTCKICNKVENGEICSLTKRKHDQICVNFKRIS